MGTGGPGASPRGQLYTSFGTTFLACLLAHERNQEKTMPGKFEENTLNRGPISYWTLRGAMKKGVRLLSSVRKKT